MTTPDITPAPVLDQQEIHTVRLAEYEIAKGIIAFTALAGGVGADDTPNPLWTLAQDHGWTLDDFVREVLCLTDSIVVHAIDRNTHLAVEHDCPCRLVRDIRSAG